MLQHPCYHDMHCGICIATFLADTRKQNTNKCSSLEPHLACVLWILRCGALCVVLG